MQRTMQADVKSVPKLRLLLSHFTEWNVYDEILELIREELVEGGVDVHGNVISTFHYLAPGLEIKCDKFDCATFSTIMATFSGPICNSEKLFLIFSDHEKKVLNATDPYRRQQTAIMRELYVRTEGTLLEEIE